MPTLTCPVCGKQFHRPRCHIRNATHACSRACSEKLKPRREKVWIYFTCKWCGKETRRRKGGGGTFEYCSSQCRSFATTPKGASHPNWRGGDRERSPASRIAIRKRIREVGHCERCGSTIELQGHHRKSYWDFPDLRCDPENIEVLCAVCHGEEHPPHRQMLAIARKRSGIDITCIVCGKKRYVQPSLAETAKYCSRVCQRAHLHRRR